MNWPAAFARCQSASPPDSAADFHYKFRAGPDEELNALWIKALFLGISARPQAA
ncbi:MAG: hypothetical protein IPH73_08110 [Rhodocyclales bacterium]|nr:hypothetical protein [Rhodocyclales bacterium]